MEPDVKPVVDSKPSIVPNMPPATAALCSAVEGMLDRFEQRLSDMLDERFAQVRASLDASFARFTLTGEELPQSTLIGLERVRITNMNAATQSSVYHLFPNLKGVYHPPHLDEQERLPHSFRKGLYIRDATIAAYLAHHAVEASPPHHKHSTRARRFRKFLEGKL